MSGWTDMETDPIIEAHMDRKRKELDMTDPTPAECCPQCGSPARDSCNIPNCIEYDCGSQFYTDEPRDIASSQKCLRKRVGQLERDLAAARERIAELEGSLDLHRRQIDNAIMLATQFWPENYRDKIKAALATPPAPPSGAEGIASNGS